MWEKSMNQLGDYWSNKLNSDGPAGELNVPPIPISGFNNDNHESSENNSDDESDENSNDESSDTSNDESTETSKSDSTPSFGLA
jgi:hypothetical protein